MIPSKKKKKVVTPFLISQCNQLFFQIKKKGFGHWVFLQLMIIEMQSKLNVENIHSIVIR